jgi:hypothetical protein
VFTVAAAHPVATVDLLIESPDRFDITLNGMPVPRSDAGEWFVDPCLRRVRLPGGLRAGQNTLELACTFTPDIELEPCYLLGAFGVYVAGDTTRIDRLPDTLRVGSWHDQGLAFYAGQVTYTLHADIEGSADRWELHCPHYRNAIRVHVDGLDAGTILWAPHTLDLTEHLSPGRHRIDLIVANSLRNFFGPHHLVNEDNIDCLGPNNFFDHANRGTDYRFKPAGLLGPVTLRGYHRA